MVPVMVLAPVVVLPVGAAAASPPGAPELISPAAGQTLAAAAPHVFTVRVTDPDGDRWIATIEATNLDTGRVTTAVTSVGASGGFASAVAVPPLSLGHHQWRARAVDATGTPGPWSDVAAFRVGTNQAPAAPTLAAPADGATLRRVANEPFAIGSVDPDGDAYSGKITVRDADDNTIVAEIATTAAPSGGLSRGVLVTPLGEGAYTWSAVAEDVHGAGSNDSTVRTFTVGPPATGGGGTVLGTISYAAPGLPRYVQSCEPSSGVVSLDAAAVVFNTAIVGFVGTADIEGTASSSCETALSGSGSLTVDVAGTGTTGSTLTCVGLSGPYARTGQVLVVSLTGGCVVNNLPVSRVTLTASLAFTPTGPQEGVTTRVLAAALAGSFVARPD